MQSSLIARECRNHGRRPSIARGGPRGAVGAGGADDVAGFAALAAFLERGLPRLLDVVARHDRPARRRHRKGAAGGAEKADLGAAWRGLALRPRAGHGLLARRLAPRHAPLARAFVVDDGAPGFQAADLAQPREQALGDLAGLRQLALRLELP